MTPPSSPPDAQPQQPPQQASSSSASAMEQEEAAPSGGRPPPLIPPRAPPPAGGAARKRSREDLDGEALLAAASHNDAAAIRELVTQRGVPVDWSSRVGGGGQTALHLAAFASHVEAIQALVELGASINLPNDISGATPLHLAAMGKGSRPRKAEAIAALVAAGADCFQQDRYGSQPWHYAHDSETRLLMKGPEFKLHAAVLNKALGELGELLRAADPAHVNEPGPDGNTPLHVAACVRSAEAARMLVTAGADPDGHNEHGARPLHTAVSVLAEEVAEVLIAAGARVDAKTILVYEYHSKGVNWVEPGDSTPLSSPKSVSGPGSGGSSGGAGGGGGVGGGGSGGPSPRNRREYRVAGAGAGAGAEAEGQGRGPAAYEDKTPLHLAVATKHGLGMARFLLSKGADPNATDARGRACLQLALERLLEASPVGIPAETEACLAMVRLLLEKGADPLRPHPVVGGGGGSSGSGGREQRQPPAHAEARRGGHRTALHWCVERGHVDALEAVLAHTFGPVRQRLLNGADGDGMTPLMLSAQGAKVGCLEALLRHGADAGLANAEGLTARALAERQGHAAAVCILDTFSSFAGVA